MSEELQLKIVLIVGIILMSPYLFRLSKELTYMLLVKLFGKRGNDDK